MDKVTLEKVCEMLEALRHQPRESVDVNSDKTAFHSGFEYGLYAVQLNVDRMITEATQQTGGKLKSIKSGDTLKTEK